MTSKSDTRERAIDALGEAYHRYLDWRGPGGDVATFLDWVRDEAPGLPRRPDPDPVLSRGARYAISRLGQPGFSAPWLRDVVVSVVGLLRRGRLPEIVIGAIAEARDAGAVLAVLEAATLLDAQDESREVERGVLKECLKLTMVLGILTHRGMRVVIDQQAEPRLYRLEVNSEGPQRSEASLAGGEKPVAAYGETSLGEVAEAVWRDPWFRGIIGALAPAEEEP